MTDNPELDGAGITLCVTGSIAAYKAVGVARLLVKAGALVQTVFSHSASKFVGPATFSGLTGNAVLDDMWARDIAGEGHIDLAADSDAVVIVPATADCLARLASGRADDLVTALALSATCPVFAAPAMHPHMWRHPATRRNVSTLLSDGRVELVGPVEGEVASGEFGLGRMVEPEDVVERVASRLRGRDLEGKHLIVTAGPTVEDLDPVRFLGNRSTGRMGFAVAERAAARGAAVTLITGPVSLETPPSVDRVDVRSALELQRALDEALGEELKDADAVIMTAAVGDYRPAQVSDTKLKRSEETLSVELAPNPDVIGEVGKRRSEDHPLLVAFAVETAEDETLVKNARGKLERKQVDLVVANHARDSFGRDENRAFFVTKEDSEALGELSKRALGDFILDWIVAREHER